jgi:hypothetical protein
MALKKKAASSGSDPKSKRIVAKKMEAVMGEFKRHELKSGGSGQKVTNPRQTKAIALSEARQEGADIPSVWEPSLNAGKHRKKT